MKLTGMIAIGSIATASVAVPVSYSVIHNHQEHQKIKRSSRIVSTRTTTAVNTFKGTMNLSSDFNAITTTVDYAQFYNEENIEEISMPQVTTVGDFAFNKSNIKSIDLPEVSSIGKYAFSNSSITNLNLPKLSRVGKNAFVGIINKHSTTVTLPGSFHSNYVLDRLFGTGKYNNINFTFSRTHVIPSVETTVTENSKQELIVPSLSYDMPATVGHHAIPELNSHVRRKGLFLDDDINGNNGKVITGGIFNTFNVESFTQVEANQTIQTEIATLDWTKVGTYSTRLVSAWWSNGVTTEKQRDDFLSQLHTGVVQLYQGWRGYNDIKLTRDNSPSGYRLSVVRNYKVGGQRQHPVGNFPISYSTNALYEISNVSGVNNNAGTQSLRVQKIDNIVHVYMVGQLIDQGYGEDGADFWNQETSITSRTYNGVGGTNAPLGTKSFSLTMPKLSSETVKSSLDTYVTIHNVALGIIKAGGTPPYLYKNGNRYEELHVYNNGQKNQHPFKALASVKNPYEITALSFNGGVTSGDWSSDDRLWNWYKNVNIETIQIGSVPHIHIRDAKYHIKTLFAPEHPQENVSIDWYYHKLTHTGEIVATGSSGGWSMMFLSRELSIVGSYQLDEN